MSIYASSKVLPYVYRLDNPVTGEFCIGVRWANKVPSSEDLGHHYFTSSKVVTSRFHEFELTILAEFFTFEDALQFEEILIAENWDKIPVLMNRNKSGKQFYFIRTYHSEETKRKMREAWKHRGQLPPISEETRAKMKNRIISDETRAAMSKRRKGIPTGKFSDTHIENLKKAAQKRVHFPHSEETKRKMRDATHPLHSEETKKKMSDAKKGKHIGNNNPNAKQIVIYDNLGNIKYLCKGNFTITCKTNNLPKRMLAFTLKENKIIPSTSKFTEFIGWYARYYDSIATSTNENENSSLE